MSKYITPYTIICSIIFASFSCSEKRMHEVHEDAGLIQIEDFGRVISLKSEELVFDEIVFNPFKMILKDSLLILYNVNTDYAFQIFNINNSKYLGERVHIGKAPNEMIRPAFIQNTDSGIWILDAEKHIIYHYFANEFLKKREPYPIKTINQKIEADQLSIIGGKFFGLRIWESMKNRFLFFDMNGDSIDAKGKYPPNNINLTDQETSYGYTGNYTTNFKDRIFLTHFFTDLIEIYDTDGTLIRRIQGPDNFLPHVKEYKTEDISFGYSKKDARVAYSPPANAGEEVFVAYNGGLYSEDTGHKKDIFVFDWDGKPIRKYELDKPVYGIIVDSKNKHIYGFSDIPECHIVRYSY